MFGTVILKPFLKIAYRFVDTGPLTVLIFMPVPVPQMTLLGAHMGKLKLPPGSDNGF